MLNKKPSDTMKPRKRIALNELQVLVSVLVKFWRKKHGDSISDICKPKWWPCNIRFAYPIRRDNNVSPAMWRKDLIAIVTNYYYTTRNQPNGSNVLNNSDFLWQIQGQMFHNNNNNGTMIKPHRSKSENNITLSENTLKRLMPRLEVRLVDILATDEYRKFQESVEHNQQKQFLRNLYLITIPEYDKMNFEARYTFRASTKVQSDSKQTSPKLQWQQVEKETIRTVEQQHQEQLVEAPVRTVEEQHQEQLVEAPVRAVVEQHQEQLVEATIRTVEQQHQEQRVEESNERDSEEQEKHVTVEQEIIMLAVEPDVLVDKLPETEVCLLEKQEAESPAEEDESHRESSILMEKTSEAEVNGTSSRHVNLDLDELSLKARKSLQQCSPSYVKLNKCKTSNAIRRMKKLKKQKIKPRVLQPRTARVICSLKINSSYIRTFKKKKNVK